MGEAILKLKKELREDTSPIYNTYLDLEAPAIFIALVTSCKYTA